jgi:hypothetical protein
MTFLEIYTGSHDISLYLGLSLSVVHTVLSLIYFAYRYAKGDDIPEHDYLDDILTISKIKCLVNPFYFKHPMYIILAALSLLMIPVMLATTWPAAPLTIIYYFIHRIRKVNIEKKKMWAKLKS